MLTEEQMRDALRQCPHDTVENLRVRWLYAKDFARAIESAACAERDARIAELEKDCDRFERYWNEAMATHKNIAELERQLEEARKDAADADSMCEAMKKVIDQNDARWKFLHTTNKDAEGYEWCVLRVKWENGRISEALHTYSNMADLDAAIKEQT